VCWKEGWLHMSRKVYIRKFKNPNPTDQINEILADLGYNSRYRRESMRPGGGVKQAPWTNNVKWSMARRCNGLRRRILVATRVDGSTFNGPTISVRLENA